MTREEYMNSVRDKLSGCPEDYRDEIVTAFEEHFEEGRGAGRSDDEIIAELGDVADVLNDIPEMAAEDSGDGGNGSNGGKAFRTAEDTGSKSGSGNSYSGFEFDFENLGNSISRMVHDDIMQNVKKTLKESLKFGTGVSYRFYRSGSGEMKNRTGRIEDVSPFTDIEVEGTSLDIKVRPGDMLTYNYNYASDVSDLKILYEGGTIRFTNDTNTGNAYGVFNKGLVGDFELTVPQGIEGIRIKTSSGDMVFEDLNLGRCQINTGSGDFDGRDLRIRNLELRSGSGDVKIRDGEIEYLNLMTGSGDLDAVGAIQSLSMKSGSGDIDVHSHGQISSYDISTGAGDVALELSDTSFELNFRTVSGDITSDYGFTRTGTGGRVENGTPGIINVKTATGDLELTRA